MGKKIFDRLERFIDRDSSSDGCWLWTGSTDDKGYGRISSRKGRAGSPEKAHRVAYEKYVGDIPKGKKVLHECDNPPCVNPVHLFLGGQKENMQDCSAKGRLNKKSLLNLRPGEQGFRGAGSKSSKEIRNG